MEKVDQVELPNKLYFRIGEVAKILGVKPYVLRYWETEFSVLRPGKTPSRHRLYRKRDVETLLEIKRLLYEEGFTIAGAKKRLKETEKIEEATSPPSSAQPLTPSEDGTPLPDNYRHLLREIRKELLTLHAKLSTKLR
ncbi:MAG TPA: MerR family transcriptional regulator [Methylomirabilota bacterium]|jgi:DNA-binding transcriptional MerR regulator|nr:MerR family transcriptional regulator [Methylomirabilota bacterium]